jgi:tripartite-type tricarboxylate transporter receptor subunit TctC
MKRFMLSLATLLMLSTAAWAQTPITFEGKTITMIIGSQPGGGTDAAARVATPFLAKYLPGNPRFVLQNMPGADGVTAMMFFMQHVKPDGLTVKTGSGPPTDPTVYRQAQVKYDPTRLEYIGGIGRGGSTLMIRKDAEARLYEKSKPPVIMGTVAGVPRSGMQTTAWGIDLLGWNAKWVLGYPGTNDLFIALERGEIEMTASSNLFQVKKMLETGKVKVLTQTGSLSDGRFLPRSEFEDVPVFPNQVAGKVKSSVQEQGYQYWFSLVLLDKWIALPPDTPQPIVEVYREAFKKMAKDPEFLERGKTISQDFETQSAPDVAKLIKTLAATSPEAFDYINAMLKRQGIGN